MKLFIAFFFMLVGVFSLYSQTDTTYLLKEFEVTSGRIDNFSAGQKKIKFDSIQRAQFSTFNLGELITKNTSVHINTYSHNGLSQISFRGTSATHTGIYWNGFELNQPNLGQIDLALLPGGFFNQVQLIHGGGSSLYGSGNIGGSIHLNSHSVFTKHIQGKLQMHAASFDEFGLNGGISWSDGKWYLNTKLIGKKAANDFSYEDLNGESLKLANAALEQFGIIQDISLNAGKDWILGSSFWYQENEKQIPATLTMSSSDASQNDRSLRSYISAKKYLHNGYFSVRSAVMHDMSHYFDPDSIEELQIDSKIETWKTVTESQFEKQVLKNSIINAGLIYSHTIGKSIYYENLARQDQFGIFALWYQSFPQIGWKMNLNIRQDLIENYDVPLTPSVGFEGKVYKFISARVNLSRNFRVPTFNDRFWIPGGNINLEPEVSWNEEAAVLFDFNLMKYKSSTSISLTAFNSNVDNWILWVPDGLFWSAQNVQKVWSRGWEADITSSLEVFGVRFLFSGGYTYAKSTNEVKQSENDQTFKKQLIYIPEHRYYVSETLIWKTFSVNYRQNFTGERFVTKDNEQALPGFQLADLSVSKRINFHQNMLDINVSVNNIWDTKYQAVQYNPMPGRYYKLSINLTINKSMNENE